MIAQPIHHEADHTTLDAHDTPARTVTVTVRYVDFTTVTRAETLTRPTCDPAEVRRVAAALQKRTDAGPDRAAWWGCRCRTWGASPTIPASSSSHWSAPTRSADPVDPDLADVALELGLRRSDRSSS